MFLTYILVGGLMKKIIMLIMFFLFISSSFIITNKVYNLVIEKDKLMIKIKEVAPTKNINSIDGIILNNSIIPGISGLEVNLKNSYKKMKKYGIYSDSLLVFDEVEPNNLLDNNYDKYIISGNKNKKMISLIFIIDEKDNIDKCSDILDKYEVKGNFFVDGYWFEKNKENISDVINNGHIIGNLSFNNNYEDGAYIWMDTIIKRNGQNSSYCYMEEENSRYLNICSMNNSYTIKPSIVLKNNYYSKIKNNLENGMIISLYVNNNLLSELSSIINYIKGKGYSIETLDILLSEKL